MWERVRGKKWGLCPYDSYVEISERDGRSSFERGEAERSRRVGTIVLGSWEACFQLLRGSCIPGGEARRPSILRSAQAQNKRGTDQRRDTERKLLVVWSE